MKTQQEMIKTACMSILGRIPAKGADAKAAFTPEVREKIADLMMPLLGSEWEIKSERTKERARDYIVGVQSTDLLQNWTFEKRDPKEKKEKEESVAAAPAKQKLTVAEILELKAAGFSVEDIAKLMG